MIFAYDMPSLIANKNRYIPTYCINICSNAYFFIYFVCMPNEIFAFFLKAQLLQHYLATTPFDIVSHYSKFVFVFVRKKSTCNRNIPNTNRFTVKLRVYMYKEIISAEKKWHILYSTQSIIYWLSVSIFFLLQKLNNFNMKHKYWSQTHIAPMSMCEWEKSSPKDHLRIICR